MLGLLWIVLRIIRRVSGRSHGGGAARSARNTCTIELLNRRAIGRTASVAAVRVGSKMYVLGITDQRIDKLDECPAPDFDLDVIALSSEFNADGESEDALEEPNRSRGMFDPRRRRASFLDSLRERTVR